MEVAYRRLFLGTSAPDSAKQPLSPFDRQVGATVAQLGEAVRCNPRAGEVDSFECAQLCDCLEPRVCDAGRHEFESLQPREASEQSEVGIGHIRSCKIQFAKGLEGRNLLPCTNRKLGHR